MKKYRDLTPEEQWEIIDNLTPQDITNGMVDHYLNDNVFWRDVEYEHPDLLSFLDNRCAIINKEYGLEKLHHLSKHHPRKKWEQSIAWYNYENNQNTNENKNMKQNKIKITENELKQIVAESVKKVLDEASYDKNGNFDAESHNSDLKDRFASVLEKLVQSMDYAINQLSNIQTSTTDENISEKARIVINDLLNRDTLAKQVYRSVRAGRWDI